LLGARGSLAIAKEQVGWRVVPPTFVAAEDTEESSGFSFIGSASLQVHLQSRYVSCIFLCLNDEDYVIQSIVH